ncbi:GSCOCG00001860001-RA-CDS [Cotesia congregata]|nr:GSCOCG00001860001-RA-CDS [Cotesia congregata]
MEIVIENPTDSSTPITPITNINPNFGTLPGPHRQSYRVHGIDSAPADYYGTLPVRAPRHMVPVSPAEFEPAQVRRVDKSGLLEIVEPRTRHLTGAENSLGHPTGVGGSGTLNRRIDRSGLLEAVPEVPDQLLLPPPKSPETSLKAKTKIKDDSASISQNRSISERLLTGAEIDKSISRAGSLSQDETSSINVTQSNSPYARRHLINQNQTAADSPSNGNNSSNVPSKFLDPRIGRQTYVDLTGASYTRVPAPDSSISSAKEEVKEKKHPPDCLGRLSPKSRDKSPLKVAKSEVSGKNAQKTAPGSINKGGAKETPEGERAEAEGCEHTAIESLEETRVSFKASNKLLHNDNIQTLRVIILSEQL